MGSEKEEKKFKNKKKASMVYPFMDYQNEKSLYVISNNELCEIIAYIEQCGLI